MSTSASISPQRECGTDTTAASRPTRVPPIIGFAGPKEAGKTTCALELSTNYDYHRISFADPIREMLLGFGLSSTDLSANKEIPHLLLGGKTPRQAMQTLGTEWGRDRIAPDIWLRAARHRACRILDRGLRVVFDDVRFDNEAQMIRALGGQVIRIVRGDSASSPTPLASSLHPSEAGVDPALVSATLHAQDYLQLKHVVMAYMNDLAGPVDRAALDVAQALGESGLPSA